MRSGPLLSNVPTLLSTQGWDDYGLLDSGQGRKLERYGPYRIIRPEPQCLWQPRGPDDGWTTADAEFDPSDDDEAGRWRFSSPLQERWPLAFDDVRFYGRFTAFRHLAVFPEQASHWRWLAGMLKTKARPLRILNLFGYTGVISLIAAARGCEVTHVDASKKAIGWARDNAALSELSAAPIRWVCEDARRYVQREVRRGTLYDGIILDPPKFGRGPNGEVWRLLTDLPQLLTDCVSLLAPQARFLLLNGYAERISGLAMAGLLAEGLTGRSGQIDWGELALMESAGDRGVGVSFFARWIADL